MNWELYAKRYEKILIDIVIELQDYMDSNRYDYDYQQKVYVLYQRLQMLKKMLHTKLKKDGRICLGEYK